MHHDTDDDDDVEIGATAAWRFAAFHTLLQVPCGLPAGKNMARPLVSWPDRKKHQNKL